MVPLICKDMFMVEKAPEPAIFPDKWTPLKVKAIERLSKDTCKYTFGSANPKSPVVLPVASCLLTKAKIDGKNVIKPYTPTSPAEAVGTG